MDDFEKFFSEVEKKFGTQSNVKTEGKHISEMFFENLKRVYIVYDSANIQNDNIETDEKDLKLHLNLEKLVGTVFCKDFEILEFDLTINMSKRYYYDENDIVDSVVIKLGGFSNG